MARKYRPFSVRRGSARLRAFSARSGAILGTSAGLALIAVSLTTSQARAQAISGEFALQRFDPAAGPRNYLSTRGVRMDGQMAFSAGFVANYSYLPFVVRSCITETDCNNPNATRASDTKVIENMITGNALATLTVIPRLQLGLNVPVTWSKGQGINSEGLSSKGGISAVGAGDATVEGKFRLHGAVTDPFVVGVGAFVTAPLGHLTAKGAYIGDTLPSAGIRGIFDGEQGPLSFGANLTGVFRDKGTVGSTTVGSEARYSIAGGYRVGPVVRLILDAFGTTRFSAQRGENTLELDGGAQFTPLGSPVMISVGAGSGVVEGIGVPRLRVLAGVLYSLEKRDRDGDGIDDSADQCPTVPEDKDGNEDSDGCPDPDNDLDTVPDTADKCPNEPEDQDGFEDRDGCPDPDNDKDGILDVSDQCPNQAETKNGYKDEDGCPDEADSDNDGVPDSRDKCPKEAEDTDGFQDTDGCPDLDNDGDGIPDAQDECIDEPETKNGFEDEDGCPDDPNQAKAHGPAKPKKK